MKDGLLKKRIWLISLVITMTFASVTTAMGAGSGQMELFLKYRNITFDIYKVGEYQETGGKYQASLTGEFVDSGVDLDGLWEDASETRKEALALQAYVRRHRPSAYRSGVKTSANQDSESKYAGKAVVENLEDGVYLFVKSGGSSNITVSPFLITMPYYEESDGTWSYYVKAYPKSETDSDGRHDDDDDDDGGGGGGEDRENPPGDFVNIEDDGPPLTNMEIPDGPVPLIAIPKLGDFGVAGYLIAALAFGMAGGAAIRKGRNRRENEK